MIEKLGNRTTVNTYTHDPMLFQFSVTTVTLIVFTQNSDLDEVFRKFKLKATMTESDNFMFNKPMLMVGKAEFIVVYR